MSRHEKSTLYDLYDLGYPSLVVRHSSTDTNQSWMPVSFTICIFVLRVLASVAFIDIHAAWIRHRPDPMLPPSLLQPNFFGDILKDPAFKQDRWPHGSRMGGFRHIRLRTSRHIQLSNRLTGSAPAQGQSGASPVPGAVAYLPSVRF